MTGIKHDAELIESLFPKIMRALFRPDECDPINQLPMAQLRLMRVLFSQPHTVGELAEELNMSLSSVSQLVHRLAEVGYAETTSDDQDKRFKNVSLTPLGRELMSNRRANRVSKAEAALGTLSDGERTEIMASLKSLLSACESQFPTDPETLVLTAEIEQILPPLEKS